MIEPLTHTEVIIIGAGMAGLAAATALERSGVSTVVLDRGRAPGGRMATRTVDRARFDHGAQHFSARSDEFQRRTTRWQGEGVIRVWYRSHNQRVPGGPTEPRLVGVGGMRGIPEHLAEGLTVRTSVLVDQIRVTLDSVVAMAGGRPVAEGSAMILTPPPPQLIPVLAASDLPVAPRVLTTLRSVQYNATLAVMATLDAPSGLPDGHLARAAKHVAWVADNQHKGVSAVPAITIHSTPQFAAPRLDADPETWTQELCTQVQDKLAATIVGAVGHRWRYAEPRTTFDIRSLALPADRPIVLAGEVFAGARVEGAFLSGLAAANEIQGLL